MQGPQELMHKRPANAKVSHALKVVLAGVLGSQAEHACTLEEMVGYCGEGKPFKDIQLGRPPRLHAKSHKERKQEMGRLAPVHAFSTFGKTIGCNPVGPLLVGLAALACIRLLIQTAFQGMRLVNGHFPQLKIERRRTQRPGCGLGRVGRVAAAKKRFPLILPDSSLHQGDLVVKADQVHADVPQLTEKRHSVLLASLYSMMPADEYVVHELVVCVVVTSDPQDKRARLKGLNQASAHHIRVHDATATLALETR